MSDEYLKGLSERHDSDRESGESPLQIAFKIYADLERVEPFSPEVERALELIQLYQSGAARMLRNGVSSELRQQVFESALTMRKQINELFRK